MAELTQEQIARAVMAMDGCTASVIDNLELDRMARAAAPFLQLPLDQPTEDEAKVIHSTNLGMNLTATFDQCKWNVLREFVDRRNAALLPKPVDPRKAAIVQGISSYGYFGDQGALADRILAALDEVK